MGQRWGIKCGSEVGWAGVGHQVLGAMRGSGGLLSSENKVGGAGVGCGVVGTRWVGQEYACTYNMYVVHQLVVNEGVWQ